MKLCSFTIPGCMMIFLLFPAINIQAQSIYDANGKVKSIEQRRYEESQSKKNTYTTPTTPATNTNSEPYGRSRLGKIEPVAHEVTDPTYKYSSKVGSLVEGLGIVSRYEDSYDGYGTVHTPKYGFANDKGEVIIPLIYDVATDFSAGAAQVTIGYLHTFLIDRNGKELSPNFYDHMSTLKDGMSAVLINSKMGYVDKTGTEVIAPQYKLANDFSEGIAGVQLTRVTGGGYQDGEWIFIDKKGKQVIPLTYVNVSDFSEGLASVKLNGKWGFIDKAGKEIIPFQYETGAIFSEGLASVKQYGKYGYIDRTGKVVVPVIYEYGQAFSEGVASVKSDGKYGYIDKAGKVVIPFQYYDGRDFKNGVAKVRTSYLSGDGSTWLVINKPVLDIPVLDLPIVKKNTPAPPVKTISKTKPVQRKKQ